MTQKKTKQEEPEFPVQSRLDTGELVNGWKKSINKLIESVPDDMFGLMMVFMQIGTALEGVVPKMPTGTEIKKDA